MTVAEGRGRAPQKAPVHTRALIIGTGFSGLGMGIALQKQGVDFLILEKADDVGGTWRDNTYPGCGLRRSVAPVLVLVRAESDWRYVVLLSAEILDYLKAVTDSYGLRRNIVFNSQVVRAHWDDAEYRWHVFTETGEEYVAQFLISGAGALHIPSLPDIEGLDDFAARFPHRAVGPQRRSHRKAGRGDRHRRQRDPDRSRDGQDRRQVQLYQRTAALGQAAESTSRSRPRSSARSQVVPGLRKALRAATYWTLDSRAIAMRSGRS